MREDFSFGPTTKVSPRPSSETDLVCSKRMSIEKNNQAHKKMDSLPCIDLDFQVIEERNMDPIPISTNSSGDAVQMPNLNNIVAKSSLNIGTEPPSRVSSVTAFKVGQSESPADSFVLETHNRKRSTYYQLLKAGKMEEVKQLVTLEEEMES